MSIRASLVTAYDRPQDAPAVGCSAEKIGVLGSPGFEATVAQVADRRARNGKTKVAALTMVPRPVTRTVANAPPSSWESPPPASVTSFEGQRVADGHAACVTTDRDALLVS